LFHFPEFTVERPTHDFEHACLSLRDLVIRKVDPKTLSLTAAKVKLIGAISRSPCRELDTNEDGLPDLVCSFELHASDMEPGDAPATVEGQTFDGTRVRGALAVHVTIPL